MKFYSTNNRKQFVSLRDAVIEGLAPDNGLYMPAAIPTLPAGFIDGLSSTSFPATAFTVARHLLGGDVGDEELESMIERTITFDAPIRRIEDRIYSLELFHGPTLAFKDFGARFMSQLLAHFARQEQKEVTILVATSGDTGSAVANGFLGVQGARVVVLYPSRKVSEIQEKQFTTLGQNITALEVDGTFDDCQNLVKQAFLDRELKRKLFLTSANSINIARLIPQTFYYFRAYAQLPAHERRNVVFSVPSGNFGNLTAGILAKKMGLPVHHFVAATNINDVVPEYLRTKFFQARASRQTISNAMDVGNPSNFARMLDLYDFNADSMLKEISGYSFSDALTREAMQTVHGTTGYMMDPHGAIGYLGLQQYLADSAKQVTGIFLETAHPAKFSEVVEPAVGVAVPMPPALEKFNKAEKRSQPMANAFEHFRAVLLKL